MEFSTVYSNLQKINTDTFKSGQKEQYEVQFICIRYIELKVYQKFYILTAVIPST